MVLTKSQILNGINETKERYIKSKDDTVALRPLSNGEWNKIEEIENEAIGEYTTTERAKNRSRRKQIQSQMEAQAKINVKETGKASAKAKIEAVFLSLDNDVYKDDPFTRDEVEAMGRRVFDEIYDQVRIISGLDDDDLEKEVKDFPEDE
ncbi:MAG: hypothetical protein E7Z73_07885 [Methanobrevibacter millerae]|uniref:Uncharacterized protein n=1 Tax=Methanobrevibacter millerae TaxID=230361 RepID=A0A8T3VLK5_9EURY|nr:hypothetical protein [Methanobrevibacter millerae]MBE6505641.1 hypothetical protein [Methanobrevibacter millerae]